ncbi:MAG: hypothetical protein LUI13_09995 [Lachnospiraceae bacterium]|nr:hypothetical protein [Lachnospiraceae bacterium]
MFFKRSERKNLNFGWRGSPEHVYSLYGFLLDPDVLGKMLGLETWEFYRVRSIVGWISPLELSFPGGQ